MKNEIKCIYETQKIKISKDGKTQCLDYASKFLKENVFLDNDEIIYIVKASVVDTNLLTEGKYLGSDSNLIDALINWDGNSIEICLSTVSLIEDMLGYLEESQNSSTLENIYIFKILYKDYKMHKIKSFHYDVNDIDLYLFDNSKKKNGNRGEVLKLFGDRETLSAINFYVPNVDELEISPKLLR